MVIATFSSVFLCDLAKHTTTFADVGRFYLNVVICLQ